MFRIMRHELNDWLPVLQKVENAAPQPMTCETLAEGWVLCYNLTALNPQMVFRVYNDKNGAFDGNLFTEGGAWIPVGRT